MNRVLIVDDEQMVLDVTSDMAAKLGFSPMLARTANKALEIAYEQRPGIVLCDLNLGGNMDGIALCSRIRYEDQSTAMIAMSGLFSDYDKAYCLSAGFSDFLQKPTDYNELKSALQCAFERRTRWMQIP